MPISGQDLASILVPCAVFAIPITAIITSHQRKLAEIKARMGIGTDSAALNEIKSELGALRREVSSLRDTTTTFDMSFDAAISRLEHRVDRIDEASSATASLRTAPPARNDDTQIILGQKG
ncbi:MAG: hypothetical protein V4671_26765 [Armatimonadota bacterium]